MIGFFVYSITALGVVLPVAYSVIEGKTPFAVLSLSSTFVGPPTLLSLGALLAVFTPRLAGCLAFAGTVSCWIYSGPAVVHSLVALISPENFKVLGAMPMENLLKYLAGWIPTLLLFLTTLYSLRSALKLPPEQGTVEASSSYR